MSLMDEQQSLLLYTQFIEKWLTDRGLELITSPSGDKVASLWSIVNLLNDFDDSGITEAMRTNKDLNPSQWFKSMITYSGSVSTPIISIESKQSRTIDIAIPQVNFKHTLKTYFSGPIRGLLFSAAVKQAGVVTVTLFNPTNIIIGIEPLTIKVVASE